MKISTGLKNLFLALVLVSLVTLPGTELQAWTEHTLISYPALSSMPQLKNAQPVKVESLEAFLVAEGEKLELLLLEQESWSKQNLSWHAPLPPSLIFKASPDPKEARLRFINAIRISPKTILPLYLQLLPGQETKGRSVLAGGDITFLQDKSDMRTTTFVKLHEGETADPLDVVSTASNEPDMGLDIGLFEDNHTGFGKTYGFGIQPFGNPNLEFGSQAPFHMGFYHESPIVFKFASFLKKTYPEYRIHLYKKLAEFAFKTGHDYWGWRFAGWGLHYLADLAQPYHATVLPGVSTVKALWINTIDMAGIHGPKNNAVQLVSNRHLALEKFVQIVLQKAYLDNQTDHPIIKALQSSKDAPLYDDSTPRQIIAKAAHAKAAATDKIIMNSMPKQYVSDPAFEFGTSEDQFKIVEIVKREKGEAAMEKLTNLAAELLAPLAVYAKSYINAVKP
ncbi:MAG: hypothetical protein JW943_05595 [Deltaproteobacteria bacterium]|nr:hypothetical protein [Deltaproteobacteria bacterium]